MTIDLHDRVVRTTNLHTARVDDELVILNLERNNYNWLNEVGRAVWDVIESPCEVGDLCRRISQQFDAPEEEIAADILPFLNAMVEEGLARVVADGPVDA
jgi:Coenzyme PQQ synthesis protein D (PqqD)